MEIINIPACISLAFILIIDRIPFSFRKRIRPAVSEILLDRAREFERFTAIHTSILVKDAPSTLYIHWARYETQPRFFRSTFHKSAHVDPHLVKDGRRGARCIVTSVCSKNNWHFVRAAATQSRVASYVTNLESENLLNDISKVIFTGAFYDRDLFKSFLSNSRCSMKLHNFTTKLGNFGSSLYTHWICKDIRI